MNIKTFKLLVLNIDSKYDDTELYVVDVNFKHNSLDCILSHNNGFSVAIIGLKEASKEIPKQVPLEEKKDKWKLFNKNKKRR